LKRLKKQKEEEEVVVVGGDVEEKDENDLDALLNDEEGEEETSEKSEPKFIPDKNQTLLAPLKPTPQPEQPKPKAEPEPISEDEGPTDAQVPESVTVAKPSGEANLFLVMSRRMLEKRQSTVGQRANRM